MARGPKRSGHAYRTARAQLLRDSDVCWWCGHPDAESADHVIPLKVWPEQPIDPALMRPAHGVRGCPYCPLVDGKPRRCNQQRGARLDSPAKTTSRTW